MSSAPKALQSAVDTPKKDIFSYAYSWGKSPLPPTLLATLVTALHARPFQLFPMLFPPVLLFSTYLNLSEYVVDSAGLTAAWSGVYLLLANRRKHRGNLAARLGNKFSARGLTRGAAMGLAGANLIGGGLVYTFGSRKTDDESAR